MTRNYPNEYSNSQQGPPPEYGAAYGQYPQPTYDSAPQPSYEGVAGPSYDRPQPTYDGASNSTYESPATTYASSSTTYEPPENRYEPPENTYEAPNNTYEAPNNTYEGPRPPYEAEAGASSSYYQPDAERYAPPQAPIGPDSQPVAHSPNEADRGLMGALAGGAAGAYGGHKLHHGILGALGGAYAGHKLEDAIKDKHRADQQRKEDEERRRQQEMQQQQQWQQQQNYGPPPAYSGYSQQQQPALLGNFTGSARDISINSHSHGSCKLTAKCRAISGREHTTSVDLNTVIGNADGRFIWVGKGGNFTQTAQHIRLAQGGRVLEAELKNVGGQWCYSSICLDERIGNHDGQLVYIQ